ncbi:hypothetical protein ACIQC9_02315 [Brevundimonas sp. NPDC092305]|uniref:hypothetical protein n=1 Tax=Brevundimonas sp. NPDC092305 TaxID=3363957 RepID=UPI00380F369E
MTDADRPTPAEDPTFETDTVEANRAVENGQGLGAREIAAQRDPGGVSTPDVDVGDEEDDLDESVSVQGSTDDTRGDATP